MIDKFKKGPKRTVTKLNRLIDKINALDRIAGDQFIHITKQGDYYQLGLDISRLLAYLPMAIGGSVGVTFIKLSETGSEPMSGHRVVFNSTTEDWDLVSPTTLISDIYLWPTLRDANDYGLNHYKDDNVVGCVRSGGVWIALYSMPISFVPYT